MSGWFWLGELSSYNVAEPVGHATRDGIDCCVRTVDADAFKGKAKEGLLLWVIEREGLEAAEYDRVCQYGDQHSASSGRLRSVSNEERTYDRPQRHNPSAQWLHLRLLWSGRP
jgi:hypothetical protein